MFQPNDVAYNDLGNRVTIVRDNSNGTFVVRYDDGETAVVDEFDLIPEGAELLLDDDWDDDTEDLAPYREIAQYND